MTEICSNCQCLDWPWEPKGISTATHESLLCLRLDDDPCKAGFSYPTQLQIVAFFSPAAFHFRRFLFPKERHVNRHAFARKSHSWDPCQSTKGGIWYTSPRMVREIQILFCAKCWNSTSYDAQMAVGLVRAAERARSPAILQFFPSPFMYGKGPFLRLCLDL